MLAPRAREPVACRSRPPTFSIVIPAYQAADTIGQAVESALSQVHPAHEVIVVDDGSTDDLQGSLHESAGRVRLVRKQNRGAASARNAGAAVATGEFVATLDADDAFHPRRLQVLAELACARPDLDLITTDTRFIVGGRAVGRFSASNPFALEDQRRAILRSCFVGGWPAVRLSRLRQIGGFDESLRISHDWDCWLRLILDGSQAGLIAEPYYDYTLSAGTLTASRLASLWDRVRMLEKAASNPAVLPAEHPALMQSLRAHRSRAARTELQAALRQASRRADYLRLARMTRIDSRTRLLAVFAAAAPAAARRVVQADDTPGWRFVTIGT